MREKVILGMSGGVDSAVSAYLLQQQNYDVIALHFWVQDNDKTKRERQDCEEIAKKLNIPLVSYSLEEVFYEKIVSYYLQEAEAGRTPSPCPFCDDEIKFHLLFEEAKKQGASFVASGHYAKIEYVSAWKASFLKQEHFIQKDQCYMLYRLSPEKLQNILFPLAEIEKKEVREIAAKIGLSVAEKKDSQGICFAPEGYQAFLKQHLSHAIQEGNFIDEEGRILGKHQGYPFYTLGQRRGLGIKSRDILFITKIDPLRNEITLGKFDFLLEEEVELENTIFHLPFSQLETMTLLARARFSSTGFTGKLVKRKETFYFIYDKKNPHNAPGQHLVLFYQNYVVGGGTIR